MCLRASVTVPTILDLLSVRGGNPTIIQERPCVSISLTVYNIMSWDYLNAIPFRHHFFFCSSLDWTRSLVGSMMDINCCQLRYDLKGSNHRGNAKPTAEAR